jgi:polysaccharide biosynthesis protein PslH
VKLLWVSPFFLHPTDRGAQIRTLGILKRLHQRHEIHFAALHDPAQPEAISLSREYCAKAYPVPHQPKKRGSLEFLPQLTGSLFSKIPLAITRYASDQLRAIVAGLMANGGMDHVVCDFLTSAQYIPDLNRAVLFQHNVETTIWERHTEHAQNALKRAFFGAQARRMFAYERDVCRNAGRVIAVSPLDASRMREMFAIADVASVHTGVDIEYFEPSPVEPAGDLVFTGSMDWLPNIDGILWFTSEILPLIRKRLPDCTLTVAGRRPTPDIERLAANDPRVRITGTVPDIRPYLWGSTVSIVPLRIGGGTRLKIYESMAARIPVVSTTLGAEGLDYTDQENLCAADSPQAFADACVQLICDGAWRGRIVQNAWQLVTDRFSWERVSLDFENLLQTTTSGTK